MAGQKSYGQFCPVAMSAELLCKRWTMLVIRELLDGPLGFNDIRSGVLLMSCSLLSARLVELEQSGLLRHISAAPGHLNRESSNQLFGELQRWELLLRSIRITSRG